MCQPLSLLGARGREKDRRSGFQSIPRQRQCAIALRECQDEPSAQAGCLFHHYQADETISGTLRRWLLRVLQNLFLRRIYGPPDNSVAARLQVLIFAQHQDDVKV